MAHQAPPKDAGAVGPLLLYPDGRLQRAGVALGIGGGAAHVHRLLRPDEEGNFKPRALPQFVSSMTADCMLVRKKKFSVVGSFNEENSAVAFNDVDLWLKLSARCWQNLFEPRSTLVHVEGVSRGRGHDPTGTARLATEIAALEKLWSAGGTRDHYHQPAHSRFSEQFALDV